MPEPAYVRAADLVILFYIYDVNMFTILLRVQVRCALCNGSTSEKSATGLNQQNNCQES